MSNKTKPAHRSLEQYFANEAATDAMHVAYSDPEAAKKVLLIAASHITRREELPGDLANFLANAIELAMAKPQKFRAKALTDELGLTASNRRPAGSFIVIGIEVEGLLKQGASQENVFSNVAEKFSISEETVKRYWKKFKPRGKKFDEDMAQRASTRAQGQKPHSF